MKRFQFFLGPALLILFVVLLTLSVDKPLEKAITECATERDNLAIKIDPQVVELYNSRKIELNQKISKYFDNAIKKGDIVGAGVSIVHGDSILLTTGFGKRNIKDKATVDNHTLFRLGSLSKGFAGVLAGILNSEGQLNYNDKVADYIPEFSLGSFQNTQKITLKNILSHTSGTPYHSYTDLVEAGLSMTKIASSFNKVKPISEPGVLYSYQNAMFALSGEMMYRATGLEIGELLEKRIFKPLGMQTASSSNQQIFKSNNVAMPHKKRRYGWNKLKLNNRYYNAVAAGGINASSEDMAKWMRFLLGHKPEVLNQKSLAKVFAPNIEIKGRNKYYQRWSGHQSSHYASGWRIHKFIKEDTDVERTVIHHGGSVNNYRNEIAIYPEDDFGICVLFNSNTKLAKNVIPDLYEIVSTIYQEDEVKMITTHLADTELDTFE